VQGPGALDVTTARDALRQVIESFMLTPASSDLPRVARDDWPNLTALVAPDGTPLLRVDVALPHADTSVQYALVHPSRGAFYFVRAHSADDVGLIQGGCQR
jgi:hypothetical protein